MKAKRLIAILAALLLLAVSTVSCFGAVASESSRLGKFRATTGSKITNEDYVIDMAELLTTAERDALSSRCAELSSMYECGVYILTVYDMYDLGYTFIETFAEDWFDTMGYGFGDTGNGVMLVQSVADRDYDIDAHGNFGNRAFTDYGKEVMADRFVPYLSSGDWYGAYSSYLDTAQIYLERGWNGEYFDIGDSMQSLSERILEAFQIALIPSLIAALAVVLALKGKMNTARAATRASSYLVPGSIVISRRKDRFTHTTTTRRARSSATKSGGGGTSIGGGGHSHHSGKY
ncbi:MAG: TPM domain-containing protein [Firmicutes bacterium]|nr:TPM domain-containing protein [Bacillota bacterium]